MVSATGSAVAQSAGAAAGHSALRDIGAHSRFWTVVVLGLAIDLWSKNWAFTTLRQGGRRVLIPNVLELQTTLNPGALFGIGKGHTEVFLVASLLALVLVLWMFAQSPPRRWIMQVALGAILAGALGNMYDRVLVQLIERQLQTPGGPVVRYFVRAPGADAKTILLREYPADEKAGGFTLPVSAGADLGEEVGYVRDFIKIPTRWFRQREIWPWVFNVADMLLVGGVAVLALRLMFDGRGPGVRGESDLDAGVGSS